MKLYDLPQRQDPRPRIHGLNPAGHADGWVEFDHIDGVYSLCFAYDAAGNYLGVCHLQAGTPVVVDGAGFRLAA